MNKNQAVQAFLDTIELSFNHRILEQTVNNHSFVNADICEWFIECIHHHSLPRFANGLPDHRGIGFWIDELAEKTFYRLYKHSAEHSILGEWWKFNDKTSLRIPQAVAKIRRSYKVALESLQRCDGSKQYSRGFTVLEKGCDS